VHKLCDPSRNHLLYWVKKTLSLYQNVTHHGYGDMIRRLVSTAPSIKFHRGNWIGVFPPSQPDGLLHGKWSLQRANVEMIDLIQLQQFQSLYKQNYLTELLTSVCLTALAAARHTATHCALLACLLANWKCLNMLHTSSYFSISTKKINIAIMHFKTSDSWKISGQTE